MKTQQHILNFKYMYIPMKTKQDILNELHISKTLYVYIIKSVLRCISLSFLFCLIRSAKILLGIEGRQVLHYT